MEWLIRFLAGGVVVSMFAILGDVLRPRSFAGLFGAAPSIALATVTLTLHKEGKLYAGQEAASMVLGAIAFLAYAAAASYVLRRGKMSALVTTVALMPIWLGVSLGLWAVLEGEILVVEVNFAALRQSRPHEYLMRFFFGGAATVLAGYIAKEFGPGIGGLFLAFPAIFPASATLIEAHERRRKSKIGCDGTLRGRMAAGIDAAGAAMGAIGLCSFAVTLVVLLPRHNAALVIATATAVWALVSCALWKLRKHRLFGLRACRRFCLVVWNRLSSRRTDSLRVRKP